MLKDTRVKVITSIYIWRHIMRRKLFLGCTSARILEMLPYFLEGLCFRHSWSLGIYAGRVEGNLRFIIIA